MFLFPLYVLLLLVCVVLLFVVCLAFALRVLSLCGCRWRFFSLCFAEHLQIVSLSYKITFLWTVMCFDLLFLCFVTALFSSHALLLVFCVEIFVWVVFSLVSFYVCLTGLPFQCLVGLCFCLVCLFAPPPPLPPQRHKSGHYYDLCFSTQSIFFNFFF